MSPVQKIRIASFNVALDRRMPGQLAADIAGAGSRQMHNIGRILRRIRPDVVLLNEFDHDGEGRDYRPLRLFCQRFLAAGEDGIDYPYVYLAATNTGLLAPVRLHGEGEPRLPEDGLGFGAFHGQYGFAVLSRFPLLVTRLRSFRRFLWRDMPNALLPRTEAGPYYSPAALEVLPLSSKNHLDLPVQLPNGRVLHLLACHPAPPIDEGTERRNSCRNHDELRLWHDYVRPGRGDYLIDDAGQRGGLEAGADFVILGDLNADPLDGDGFRDAIQALLADPVLNRSVALGRLRPGSRGGFGLKGVGARRGSPRHWTHSQGLRLDYVLPGRGLQALASGVFWLPPGHAQADLFWNRGWPDRAVSSDHRLVWVDLAAQGVRGVTLSPR
ncbi:endonuclease/exonuclease/phosphatase family protein [Zobellella endophytica]|uniref:endonuclease/exonuclease/phosphatase family protein n=1 Tax=Zobellella endophytica TaxID=2116700 RepID=UPI001FEAA0F1|nr:endonuclease/exonuclease/phosphatase family protein [Zobellella endophytica]